MMKFQIILLLFFSISAPAQSENSVKFIQSFYESFLKNYEIKNIRDSLITNCLSLDYQNSLKACSDDSIANKAIVYAINTQIKEIRKVEVFPGIKKERPNVYAVMFLYHGFFLYTNVILIKKNNKWLIDKVTHLCF